VTSFSSALVPMLAPDIDTDQIIPGPYSHRADAEGLLEGLFHEARVRDPDFILSRPSVRGRSIILAGQNFGCGSAREAAALALKANGFRAIIAPSFGQIFRINCLENGLLPIVVPPRAHKHLRALYERNNDSVVTVDLGAGTVSADDGALVEPITIERFRLNMIAHGLDELGYLLEQLPAISRYEESSLVHESVRSRLGKQKILL
jgi:3-isopropylmalate/(R)-2-methylmalate dehydratase small subunit